MIVKDNVWSPILDVDPRTANLDRNARDARFKILRKLLPNVMGQLTNLSLHRMARGLQDCSNMFRRGIFQKHVCPFCNMSEPPPIHLYWARPMFNEHRPPMLQALGLDNLLPPITKSLGVVTMLSSDRWCLSGAQHMACTWTMALSCLQKFHCDPWTVNTTLNPITRLHKKWLEI